MTYKPQPGTQAFRILAWLEREGRTAERNSSQIASAMGIETGGIPALLAPALAGGAVFRRQKDSSSPRAPFWYSLTDHGATHRREFRPSPKDWMHPLMEAAGPPASDGAASEGKADTPGPSQPEAAPDTPQGDQAGSEPAREVMEPAVCESADGRGTNGAPALATLPQHASPGVGPMGAGQPADAGPTAAILGHLKLPPRDLATTRRAVHYDEHGGKRYCAYCGQREGSPHLGSCQGSFRAARFTDGSLHFERHGQVIASLTADEVDVLVQLLGART